MNKADVIDQVAGGAGVSRQQAEGVLDAFFDTVKAAVRGGERVAWPNFGSFSTSQRKARTGRNPRTGESVKIPAQTAIKFTPGTALKEYLNPRAAPAKKAPAKQAAPAKAAKATKAIKATKAAKATKKR